jgi:hypothetical protein
MAYTDDELRNASNRAGISFDYIKRLSAAADCEPSDPEWGSVTEKQIVVIFDHHIAKCFTKPDPLGSLREMGFIEVADAIEKMQQTA